MIGPHPPWRGTQPIPDHFPLFMKLEFDSVPIHQVNPYLIIRKIQEATREKPLSLTSESKFAFNLKTWSRDQATKILEIRNIADMACKASIHPQLNFTKGLIFLREFDLDESCFMDFKADLKAECDVLDIEPATFIKTKSSSTRAFIVTFKGSKRPYSLYIPGERSDTMVSPFRNRPMLCKNCVH